MPQSLESDVPMVSDKEPSDDDDDEDGDDDDDESGEMTDDDDEGREMTDNDEGSQPDDSNGEERDDDSDDRSSMEDVEIPNDGKAASVVTVNLTFGDTGLLIWEDEESYEKFTTDQSGKFVVQRTPSDRRLIEKHLKEDTFSDKWIWIALENPSRVLRLQAMVWVTRMRVTDTRIEMEWKTKLFLKRVYSLNPTGVLLCPNYHDHQHCWDSHVCYSVVDDISNVCLFLCLSSSNSVFHMSIVRDYTQLSTMWILTLPCV